MAVNLTPVGDVLSAVTSFIPNLIDFVVNLLPLSITMMIITFIGGIFAAVISKF